MKGFWGLVKVFRFDGKGKIGFERGECDDISVLGRWVWGCEARNGSVG